MNFVSIKVTYMPLAGLVTYFGVLSVPPSHDLQVLGCDDLIFDDRVPLYRKEFL